MSLSLNFLVQLKNLCEKELSKRGQNHHEVGTREVQSVLPSGNLSGSKKPHQAAAGNRILRSHKSKCVSSLSKENVKQIVKEKETSKNSETKTYSCANCDYSTECHSDYINHTISPGHSEYIQCGLCTEQCEEAQLDNHIMSVHLTPDFFRRGEDGSYNCIKCNKSSNYFSLFKKHLYTLRHQGLERCRVCNCNFPLKEMRDHHKECHGKEGDGYMCTICGLQFLSKMGRDRHQNTVHLGTHKIKCTKCEKMFKRQDNLKRHLDIHHSDVRCHPCPHCKLSFKIKATLEEHVRNIHSKNRYQCEKCYRGFADKSDLDNHVLTHQGFVFRCMVCGKSFATYGRREDHFQFHLNAPKRKKTNEVVAENNSHSKELNKFDSNMPCKTQTPSPQVSNRQVGDLLFSSNCQKAVDGSDSVKCEIDISDSKENLEDQNVISFPTEKKVIVRGNSKNKSVKLDGRRKPGSCKNTVCEESSVDTDKKCNNFEKDSNLGTCQSGASKLFDNENCSAVDVSLSGRTASKTVKLVDNLPKNDCCGFSTVGSGQSVTEPVGIDNKSEDICSCSTDDSMSEKVLRLTGSPVVLHPSSTIPEKILILDLNYLPGINGDIESFSSLQPDSSVTENTVFIDVNNLNQVENMEIINLDVANSYPMELQNHEVQTEGWNAVNMLEGIKFEIDSVVSDGVSAYHVKGETDSGVSLCSDAVQTEGQNGVCVNVLQDRKFEIVSVVSDGVSTCHIKGETDSGVSLSNDAVHTEGRNAGNVLQDEKFEVDSMVSTCNTDGASAYYVKGETDNGVSLCNDASQDEPTVKKKASTKKKL